MQEAYTPGAMPLQQMDGEVVPLCNFGRRKKTIVVPKWLGGCNDKQVLKVYPQVLNPFVFLIQKFPSAI